LQNQLLLPNTLPQARQKETLTMATTLKLFYKRPQGDLTKQAHEILEQRANDEPIVIENPALLLEIERINCQEVECKLLVDYLHPDGEGTSFGTRLHPRLRDVLEADQAEEAGVARQIS
jgi:hypothetical protein